MQHLRLGYWLSLTEYFVFLQSTILSELFSISSSEAISKFSSIYPEWGKGWGDMFCFFPSETYWWDMKSDNVLLMRNMNAFAWCTLFPQESLLNNLLTSIIFTSSPYQSSHYSYTQLSLYSLNDFSIQSARWNHLRLNR